MSQIPAIQARDLGGGTLEVIGIMPQMGADHPVIQALGPFSRKFRNLLFTLEPSASLDLRVLPRLLEASSHCRFKIVTADLAAFPYQASGLAVFRSVSDALLRIKGEDLADEIEQKMQSVPQLNSAAFAILQRLGQEETTFGDLEKLAAQDAGLASQILKTANSAFFARRSRVETLGGALAYLGMEGIKQILVYNVFKGATTFLKVQREVMEHGKACAHLAGFLATAAKVERPVVGKIRLAGLLHDIGSQALACFRPADYGKVRELVKNQQKRTIDAEVAIFGIEHQELGRRLVSKWAFPEYLAATIGTHHQAGDPTWGQLIDPVFCANGFLNECIEQIPATPYYQKLRGYFAHLDEKTPIQAVKDAMQQEYTRFVEEGGLTAE